MKLFLLLALLGCAQARPRLEEAFAAGQLGVAWEPVDDAVREAAARKLASRLSGESDPAARERMVEALGKLGGDVAVAALRASLAGPLDKAERARAAIALGVMFKNGRLKEPVEVARLTALLGDGDEGVRYGAAYALYRMKQPLDGCLHDSSWLVRATCARGAAHPESLLDDADERVAAEAARALAKQAVACPAGKPCPAIALLRGPWRPQVAAAIAFEPIVHADWAERVPNDGADCLLALSHDRAVGRVDRIARCNGDERTRQVLAARALGDAHGDPAALQPLYRSPHASVRAAAAEALGKLATPQADAALRQMLTDERDPAVLAAVGEAVADRHVDAGELILARLAPLHGPDAIEAVQALCRAAGVLKLRAAIPALRQRATHDPIAVRIAARQALKELGEILPAEPRPFRLPKPRKPRRVRLSTSRGEIVLRLDYAPATVENFLKLVRAGFYRGLSFHRVVPDFVVQGGDPRGDGSGGPGWMIPCEINLARYREGTVGMALSGPDTGGSQFFIALSPQPHLDGRYTVFGEVESGMDTVRKLEEGDRILDAVDL